MPDGKRPEKVIKSYNRKVVGNMLFRKAETREAEAIAVCSAADYPAYRTKP